MKLNTGNPDKTSSAKLGLVPHNVHIKSSRARVTDSIIVITLILLLLAITGHGISMSVVDRI